MRGPQHYRQPASRHASHSLALRSVGGGVEAGARHRSERQSLRVQRGVVGCGGGLAELGAAEAGGPQLGGAHRGQPFRGRPSSRSQGPGPSQHGDHSAPSPAWPGAPAGTCRLQSPRRLTPPAAWRGGQGKPPMDACGARPDPPLLARGPAEPRLEIAAWRSSGGGGGSGSTVRGCPTPRAVETRDEPRPRRPQRLASARSGNGSLGCPRARRRRDALGRGKGADWTDSLSPRSLVSEPFSAFFFFLFFFSAKLRAAKFRSPAENAVLRLAAATCTGSTPRKGPSPRRRLPHRPTA